MDICHESLHRCHHVVVLTEFVTIIITICINSNASVTVCVHSVLTILVFCYTIIVKQNIMITGLP